MFTRILPLTVAATAAVAASRIYHRAQRNWGATTTELFRHLPGDEVIPRAASDSTMAITIDAPPEAVWPWLVQMGVDRAGFYTHTWVENGLLHLGVTNAGQVVPAWQDIAPGDRIWFTPASAGDRRIGPTVLQVELNKALVLGLGDDPECWAGTWQFVLDPHGAGTRLLFRTRSAPDQPPAMTVFNRCFEPGYTYMDVGMLKGIRERAEHAASVRQPANAPGQLEVAPAA